VFDRERRRGGMWSNLAHWPLLLGAVVVITIAAILIRDVPSGNLATAFLLIAVGMITLGAFLAVYIFQLASNQISEPPAEQLDQEALVNLLLEQRRHIYKLSMTMIDQGLEPPPPPAPSFDHGEYDHEIPPEEKP
jgi:hypothetical protein